MSVAVVHPGPVSGTVRAPSSKSYTHRALVAAHLAGRPYRIIRPLRADDTVRTAEGLRALGSCIALDQSTWRVEPHESRASRTRAELRCGESGTTLRLLAAAAAATPIPTRFTGGGKLPLRPMGPLVGALGTLGAEVRLPSEGRTLPLVIRGPIRGGDVALDASVSSQFASALLLVLPTLESGSVLTLAGEVVSAPYIEATLAVLRQHRVRYYRRRTGYFVPGGQEFQGSRFRVPGDASSAAYLWAAAAIAGGTITVQGLTPGWPQADLAVLDLLRAYGASVSTSGDTITVTGREHRAFRAELTGAPDLYPLAGVLAATAPGRSELRGAPHVVHKESDRKTTTAALVRALGASVRVRPRSLEVQGTRRTRGRSFRGLTDHRLVMSAAVGALAGDRPSTISDARAVEKSFPGFWRTLRSVSGG